MELVKFICFVAIAETGNVSRAAAQLKLAQPALSRYLRQLESEIGAVLFERHGRGMTLTEQGERFYAHAKAILDRMECAELDIAAIDGKPLAAVSLGVISTITDLLIVPLTQTLRRELPRVSLRITEGSNSDLLRWLNEGRVDVAVCLQGTDHVDIDYEPLLEQSLYLVGRTNDKLPARKEVPFCNISKLPLVLAAKADLIRTQIDRVAARQGLALNVVAEANSFATAIQLVSSGRYFTIMPNFSVGTLSGRDLVAARIVEPPLEQTLIIATSLRRPLSTSAKALVRIVRHAINDWAALFKARTRTTAPANRRHPGGAKRGARS